MTSPMIWDDRILGDRDLQPFLVKDEGFRARAHALLAQQLET
jgi:hypothetical protein